MTKQSKQCGRQPIAKPTAMLPAIVLLLWLVSASTMCAQPAGGHYTYPAFSGAGISIWDVSGPYTVLEIIRIQGVDYSAWIDIDVTQDLQGKLHGGGPLNGWIDGNPLSGNYTISGSVRVVGTATVVTMTVQASGTGSIDGESRHFALSLRHNLQINSFALVIVGQSKGTLSIPGLPQIPVGSQVAFPLPAGMNGSWRLSMDITTGNSNGGGAENPARSPAQRFNGTASIRLSNGNLISCALNGSYTAASKRSRVRMSGSGASLTLNAAQSQLAIADFTGKVLGQKIHASFASPLNPSSTPIGGGGTTSGRLSGSKSGCTGWSMGVSGEDFSSNSRQSNFQYDFYNRVIREYGTITATRTGRTYSYDARYSYDFGGCFSSVTMTVSGGLLSPSSQTITF